MGPGVTPDRFAQMRDNSSILKLCLTPAASRGSLTGDAFSFVDRILAEEVRRRRIALAVPNFMFALAIFAETDLISALPCMQPRRVFTTSCSD